MYWQSKVLIASWMDCSRCQFQTKQSRNLFTLTPVQFFLWLKDKNGLWRCLNGIFKHSNMLNKILQIWCIYLLTSLWSQPNQDYYLHSACIVHTPLNIMNDVRENLWQCLLKLGITDIFVNIQFLRCIFLAYT